MKRNKMKYLFIILIALFMSACQESASSNNDTSISTSEARLKYPLQTGQVSTFVYTDQLTSKFYYDDGDFQNRNGYEREFIRLADETVYNVNYNLYWQDNNDTVDFNVSTASQTCQDMVFAGKDNWRLPNVYELMTLLDLESGSQSRDVHFQHMPSGLYYSSQEVRGTEEMIAVGFGTNDFNISKVPKAYDITAIDENASEYGIKYATITVPTYHIPNDQDPYYYLFKTVVTDMYFDAATGFQTGISTDTLYDHTGAIVSVFGPYTSTSGGTQFNPTVAPNPPKTYVKCVSGPEIAGFDFVRDDRNEVVLDRATNLVWQDSPDVVRFGYYWGEAMRYCSELTLSGYEDWRVPTIKELVTINDFSDGGTFSVDSAFLYKSASKFHSSTNSCYGPECHQKNYQLNACGYLNEKITPNTEANQLSYILNPLDINVSEQRYPVRCVRGGSYNN